MDQIIQACPLVALFQILLIAAETDSDEAAALHSFKLLWKNVPTNWGGSDPCGDGWEGINCSASHVISIKLSSMGLKGQLDGDIQFLSELQTLDLSYNKGLTGPIPPSIGSLQKLKYLNLVGCSFSGPIPNTIGSIQELQFLSLNSNSFSGQIPPSLGNLLKLYWLDLADNKLTGTIPISNGSTPGLDMLIHTKHFHFGKNQLSGSIPHQLFSSNMVLIHVLFDGNRLTGSIPPTLGLVKSLEVIRFDRNLLTGPVPSNLNNLTSVSVLHLSNNKLTGPMPNLSGMNLYYVDLSNNSFDAVNVPPWFSTLQSLTTLMMENTGLQGTIPKTLFSIPQLETLILGNNRLNGTLDIGNEYSNQLKLIDLRNNLISAFLVGGGYRNELILKGNPFCKETEVAEKYCMVPSQSNPSYSTSTKNCVPVVCPSDQQPSPNCRCSYPYMGTIFFRATSFSDLSNSSHYTSFEKLLMHSFQTYQLPVDSVSLSDLSKDSDDYIEWSLKVFPSGEDSFSRSEISSIGFMLSNQTFKPPKDFGPYVFIGLNYSHFAEPSVRSKNSVSLGIIIGAVGCGCAVAFVLLICAGVYAFRQKKRADKVIEQNKPFASLDPSKRSGSIPQLKGARVFSFDELKKCTDNFSDAHSIGSGGYGKVYRGILASGELVAIKRAQQGSKQGGLEFKTEIELLSRVHHKNLVSLVGFCFEKGEQILVYEYLPNGTLKESLTGKSGIRLDWMRRIRVALGSARGLAYLHEHANPTIIHRDIKSTNILLDDHLNAKVADFGLSKLLTDNEKGHVSTQVKGTMGYVDPEYYTSQQLTAKSDVFSFGVLLLELITARKPIERGTYIVRKVKVALDKTKEMYGLHELLDPVIGLVTTLKGFEKFVDLAMRCVEESGTDRPTMSEVVKEIEAIMQLAGLNPNAESASTSATYDRPSSEISLLSYSNEAFADDSGGSLPTKVEPH